MVEHTSATTIGGFRSQPERCNNAVKAYNLTNELYRTHTNFIKEFAPEIGRGIKFTYSLRFF